MTRSWKPFFFLRLTSDLLLVSWHGQQPKSKENCARVHLLQLPRNWAINDIPMISHGSSMLKKPLVYSGLAAWSAWPDAFFIQHPAKIFEDLAQGAHSSPPNPIAHMWIADNGPWGMRLIRRNGNGSASSHKYSHYCTKLWCNRFVVSWLHMWQGHFPSVKTERNGTKKYSKQNYML